MPLKPRAQSQQDGREDSPWQSSWFRLPSIEGRAPERPSYCPLAWEAVIEEREIVSQSSLTL